MLRLDIQALSDSSADYRDSLQRLPGVSINGNGPVTEIPQYRGLIWRQNGECMAFTCLIVWTNIAFASADIKGVPLSNTKLAQGEKVLFAHEAR
jgi:hypothetical protein